MPTWADKLDVKNQIEKPVQKAVSLHQETQKSELKWQIEKATQMALFASLEKKIQALEIEKLQQEKIHAALNSRINEKQKQLKDLEQISSQLLPYLDTVLTRIQHLYANDLPFLKDERQKRIATLESMMPDPEITVSEKFRKIMEALLVEAEYGQTIETTQKTIDIEGEPVLANIFRLGRLNLFYQTLDKQQCGFYNISDNTWKSLEDIYLKDIQAALDIGAKQKPVEMLELPIGRIMVK